MRSRQNKRQDRVGKEEILSSISSSCILPFALERLRDILENIPSAVMVLEKPDGKVTLANKRAIELFGLNPCGFKLDEYAAALKTYMLDGKVCSIEQLNTYRALFNEETI